MIFKLKSLYKDFKSLFISLITIYSVLLGVGWIIFHLYIRFLVDRIQYNIIDLKNNITWSHYLIFTTFVCIHVLLILISLFTLYKLKNGVVPQNKTLIYKFSLKINNIVDNLYWKPLEKVHNIIFPHIPFIGSFFLFLNKHWQTIGFTYLLIFFFNIFPKVLVATTFFFEIIFLTRIHTFFKMLPLLFIPVVFTIFLKLYESFAEENAKDFREPYESIKLSDPIYDVDGSIKDYTTYEFTVKDEYIGQVDTTEDLKYLRILDRISNVVDYTKQLLSLITPYVTVLTSLLYLIGGIYRIVILIF